MPLPPLNDTIAAIATAPGVGAIGVVRLSGVDSYAIADKLFKSKNRKPVLNLPAGCVTYGSVIDETELIDETLLLSFRKPHSYTGEDVIELQTHGGAAVLRSVLDLCLKQGARLAQPGEFTLRAFLSGRIDLVQAEAVLDMVNAASDSARRSASLGLSKALSEQLDAVQADLSKVYGNIQAVFDYPDEGVPESDFVVPLERSLKRINHLLGTAQAGRIAKNGARLALIGRPNAGKSSLLNALLGYQRSIVSDLPGTTRDYLEAPLSIEGIPVTAIDTAGIRQTDDAIEASGVALAKDIAANADISLLLLDTSEALKQEDLELIDELNASRTLLIASKTDLDHAWHEAEIEQKIFPVSTVTSQGLDDLRQAIREHLIGDAHSGEVWLSSERHIEALNTAKNYIERALEVSDDLAALDLQDALKALSEITGRGEIGEDALEHIFANFCVGK